MTEEWAFWGKCEEEGRVREGVGVRGKVCGNGNGDGLERFGCLKRRRCECVREMGRWDGN